MQVYDELVARGLIAQVTNEDEIREMVNNGKAVFYIGFDPTADSLHVGHFMALCLMKTTADGRQQTDRPDRRRYCYDRRPVRSYGYASDDDERDYSAQLRLFQKADEQIHRLLRW